MRSLQGRLPTGAPCAGIDYVVVDMTNLPQYDQTADAIQLRPFEVLCEVRSGPGALPNSQLCRGGTVGLGKWRSCTCALSGYAVATLVSALAAR